MIESDLAGLAERSQHTEKLSLRLKPRNKHDTAQQHTLCKRQQKCKYCRLQSKNIQQLL